MYANDTDFEYFFAGAEEFIVKGIGLFDWRGGVNENIKKDAQK
jgi:hypothetical protein